MFFFINQSADPVLTESLNLQYVPSVYFLTSSLERHFWLLPRYLHPKSLETFLVSLKFAYDIEEE